MTILINFVGGSRNCIKIEFFSKTQVQAGAIQLSRHMPSHAIIRMDVHKHVSLRHATH